MAVAFIVYALAGPYMPGLLEHKGVTFTTLIEHLYLVPEGLFNMVMGVMATFLLVFLLFGSLLRFARQRADLHRSDSGVERAVGRRARQGGGGQQHAHGHGDREHDRDRRHDRGRSRFR